MSSHVLGYDCTAVKCGMWYEASKSMSIRVSIGSRVRAVILGGLGLAALGLVSAAEAKDPPRGQPQSRASASRVSAPRAALQRFSAPARVAVQRAAPQRSSQPSRASQARVERSQPRVVERAKPRVVERERPQPRVVEQRTKPKSDVTPQARRQTSEPKQTIAKQIDVPKAPKTTTQKSPSVASDTSKRQAVAAETAKKQTLSSTTGPSTTGTTQSATPKVATQAKPPLPGRMGMSASGGAPPPTGVPKGATALKLAPAVAVGAAAAIAAGASKANAAPATLPAGIKVGNGRGVRPPGIVPRVFTPTLVTGAKTGPRLGLAFATRFPAIKGHRFAGRPRLPLFFVAGVFGFGSSYWYYRTSTTYIVDDPVWVRPLPSCYVGGNVFYREPGSGACFDFARAEPGDYFECNSRVYRWAPDRAASVEDIVAEDDEGSRAVVYEDWAKANPAYIKTKAARPARSVPTSATLEPAQLDCSSCLGAQGPIETGNGMCSLTIANNCPQPISFKGGMSRASGDGRITCEFSDDVENGSQKTVCSAPCASFDEAQAYITAATPKAGWTGKSRACRLIDPAKVAAAQIKGKSGDTGLADIYAPASE